MADPTIVQSSSNVSAVASTVVTFPGAATAGNLLVLLVAGDDYKTGDPSGWTLLSPGGEQQTFLGHNFWWKKAAGGETSVTYVIGSASKSTWHFLEFDNIDATTQLDTAAGTFLQSFGTTMSTSAITPSTGRRLIIASIGGSGGSVTGLSGWTNSYVEALDSRTSSPLVSQGTAWIVLTGNGSTTTSTTATYDTGGPGARTAIIGSFIVASGGASLTAAAALTVTATITTAAAVTRPAGATLTATAGITAAAAVTRPAGATLTANATITAAAALTLPAAATLTVTDTITAAASVAGAGADATLTVTDTITAGAAVLRPATATLAVVVSISAAATRTGPLAATLSVSAAITADASTGMAATLPMVAAIVAAAAATRPAATTLTLLATITPAATLIARPTVTLPLVATIFAAADIAGLIPLGGTLTMTDRSSPAFTVGGRTVASMTVTERAVPTLTRGA